MGRLPVETNGQSIFEGMRFNCLLLLLSCILLSCNNHEGEHPKIFDTKEFVLIDSLRTPDRFMDHEETLEYPIYYLGLKKDSIQINEPYSITKNTCIDYNHFPVSKTYSSTTLKIFVDTSIITSVVSNLSLDSAAVENAKRYYQSFMFTIENISDSLIYVGRSFVLDHMYREAKDKNGKWRAVDKSENLFTCYTGQPVICLQKGNIIISKVARYHGNFVTDFRLVYNRSNQIVYSNTFRDSINEQIFDPKIHSKF